jgi:hypothetical protein
LNIILRQPRTGPPLRDQLQPCQRFETHLGQHMAALIAIGVFIVAIFVLNLIEFGRLD